MARFRIDQPFPDRALAPGAMGVTLTPIGVQVSVCGVESFRAHGAMLAWRTARNSPRLCLVPPIASGISPRVPGIAAGGRCIPCVPCAGTTARSPVSTTERWSEDLVSMPSTWYRPQQARGLAIAAGPNGPDPVADPGIEGMPTTGSHPGPCHSPGARPHEVCRRRVKRRREPIASTGPVLRHGRAPIPLPSCSLVNDATTWLPQLGPKPRAGHQIVHRTSRPTGPGRYRTTLESTCRGPRSSRW